MDQFITMLLTAGLYVVQASGLGIIYGVMRVVNLAHAGVIMLGAYAAYWGFKLLGLDPLVSALPVMALSFLLGVLVYRFVLRRTMASEGSALTANLLALFGVWLAMQGVAQKVWTATERTLLTEYTFDVIEVGGATIAVTRLIAFGLGVVSFVALNALFRYTHLGRTIRAVAQDRDGALLAGINVGRVSALTLGIGFAFAGLAGVTVALLFPVTPTLGGGNLLVRSFLIVVLGGMESIPGMAAGALVLAAVETFGVLVVSQAIIDAVLFLLLLVVLLVLPGGIQSIFDRLQERRA
jgi:branched-chain amino acid transport system permease protein